MEREENQNPPAAEPPSVEERLRRVRESCRLLAAMFSIQAEATFLGGQVSLSVDAYNALSTICDSCGADLERLIGEMPPSIANWRGEPSTHRV
jgi:hypothetical protein